MFCSRYQWGHARSSLIYSNKTPYVFEYATTVWYSTIAIVASFSHDHSVIFCKCGSTVHAVSWDGKLLWSVDLGSAFVYWNLLYYFEPGNGGVIVISGMNQSKALYPSNGATLWTTPVVSGTTNGQTAIDKGTLYTYWVTKELQAVDIWSGNMVATVPTGLTNDMDLIAAANRVVARSSCFTEHHLRVYSQ